MAKTVWDLALLMDVMQGPDSEDPISELSANVQDLKSEFRMYIALSVERNRPAGNVSVIIGCSRGGYAIVLSILSKQYVRSIEVSDFAPFRIGVPRRVCKHPSL